MVFVQTYWITEAGIMWLREKSSSQTRKASMMSFWRRVIWYFSARTKSRARRPGAVSRESLMETEAVLKNAGKQRTWRYIPEV